MSLLRFTQGLQFAMISFDCGSLVPHEYCLNCLFFINLQYAYESAYLSLILRSASLVHNVGIGSLLTDEVNGVYLSEN